MLGPILRHVGDTTALVWVQTDAPAEVAVLGCTARTFEVQGHHYALVPVQGLTPDSVTEYQVRLDDVLVWPEPDSHFPPSVIRTRGPDRSLIHISEPTRPYQTLKDVVWCNKTKSDPH